MAVSHRVIPDQGRWAGFGVCRHALFGVLRLLDGADRFRIARAAPQASEILLGQRFRLRRIEIAHQASGEVIRSVIGAEVSHCVLSRDGVQVARPADHGPSIGR